MLPEVSRRPCRRTAGLVSTNFQALKDTLNHYKAALLWSLRPAEEALKDCFDSLSADRPGCKQQL